MSNTLTTTEDADFAVTQPAPNATPSLAKGGPIRGTMSMAEMLRERPKLAAALVKAAQHCKAVPHDATNNYHKYDYTSSEAVIIEAKEAMGIAELALLPLETSTDGYERTGENRFERFCVWLLMHSSGESIPLITRWPICIEKGRPLDKATAAADTLSLAYLLRNTLQMPRVNKEDEVSGRDDTHRANPTPPKPRPRLINPSEGKEIETLLNQAGRSWDHSRAWLNLPAGAGMGAMDVEQFAKLKAACEKAIAAKAAAPPTPAPEPSREQGDPDPSEIIGTPEVRHIKKLHEASARKWGDLLKEIGADAGAKYADLTHGQYERCVTILTPKG